MGKPKPPTEICWIRRQKCPCGEKKCYIGFDDEEKNDEASTSDAEAIIPIEVSPPSIGQVFDTDDEAFEYYSNFARKSGFAIRKESSRSDPDHGLYARKFACYRCGPDRCKNSETPQRKRIRKPPARGCGAKMYILKKIVGGIPRWSVRNFNNEHNHEMLDDDQLRLLPAYRRISDVEREHILLLYESGCTVSQIMKVMRVDKGEEGQLIQRDVRNFLRSCKKIGSRASDISELLNACKEAKEKDINFRYEFKMDENGKPENIAWSYGHSFRAYKVFGDVVIFDATYHEVTCKRILGVWLGVNNHGKIILFGCTLLQDESSESFNWALQAFLRLMRGRCPSTILTDLDLRLKDAIASVLPVTKHAFCIWHVVSKLSNWFAIPLGSRYDEFKSEFYRLYNLQNIKDFESDWNEMVARFGLGSDRHIYLLFSHRTSWALPYTRGCFLAQLTATNWSKSIDVFLKEILSARTSLGSFFEQVSVAADVSSEADEKKIEAICVKTSMPMEEHASRILTPYAFSLLQNEMILSVQSAAFETANCMYLVHHRSEDGGSHVSWTQKDEKVRCSCKGFEVSGILCRHALRVLSIKNYFQIPDKYLPFRWQRRSSIIPTSSDEWSQAFDSLTSTLYAESSITQERLNFVRGELTRVLDHVRSMATDDGVASNLICLPMDDSMNDDSNLQERISTGDTFELPFVGNQGENDLNVVNEADGVALNLESRPLEDHVNDVSRRQEKNSSGDPFEFSVEDNLEKNDSKAVDEANNGVALNLELQTVDDSANDDSCHQECNSSQNPFDSSNAENQNKNDLEVVDEANGRVAQNMESQPMDVSVDDHSNGQQCNTNRIPFESSVECDQEKII